MQVAGLADQVRAGLGNVVGRGSLETMGFQVREIVRLAVGLVARCDDRRANAGRESYGLELDVPAARDANGQLPMQVVGLADQVRAGLGNVVGRGSLETMGFQVREIVRLAVGLVTRCDDRRANAGRESYGLELDVPAARDANGQLPMQVVGLADQVRAGLGNVVGRGSLETMGFQVREIVRLAVGLVTRCDDRRANAGRESYGLELDVPAARDANGQLPMQVVGLADQVRAGLGNVVGRGSLETMGFQVREIVRLAVGLVARCDDRRANAGRESYGLELDVPAARDANGQLPMQVVGLADQVRAGLGNVVGRGSLETMGFQVREIVRLAVGLVTRCDDRRANAGRESYGLELDVPAARDANGQLPMPRL